MKRTEKQREDGWKNRTQDRRNKSTDTSYVRMEQTRIHLENVYKEGWQA